MNKFFKKICIGAMVSALAVSMIACGNNKTVETQSKTADGKVEVEYWYGLGGKLGDNMEKIISDFNASQDKYVVKGIAQEDYKTTFKNLQAAIAAKKSPALAILEPDKAAILGNKGVIENLNDYTSKDNSFNEADYLEAFMETGKNKDNFYGFPMYGTTQVIYYNKQAFKDAGISEESLKTWTGISEAAKKLVKKDGDEVSYYGLEPMWGPDNLVDAALSNGGNILSEDGKTVTINSDEWIESWESFRKWIHEDKCMRIHSDGQGWEYWYATINDVVKDKAGAYIGSSGDQGDLDFEKLGAIEQPAFKDGKEAKPVAESKLLVIPKTAAEEQKQGAYEFMKYFTSEKVNAKWSMASGYISVNKNSANTDEFKKFVAENPQASVPLTQALHATKTFIDPTDGKISDALKIAADKVEIENVSAKEALDEAQKTAQVELDKVNK